MKNHKDTFNMPNMQHLHGKIFLLLHKYKIMNKSSYVIIVFLNTRAYGAIAPEPLGCASHSYLLTEESVTDKRTN